MVENRHERLLWSHEWLVFAMNGFGLGRGIDSASGSCRGRYLKVAALILPIWGDILGEGGRIDSLGICGGCAPHSSLNS